VTVLAAVGSRLRPGSVVIVDEYLNHPGWQHGEHRAWSEYVTSSGLRFRYEALTHDHEQVVVVGAPTTVDPDGLDGKRDEQRPGPGRLPPRPWWVQPGRGIR
jgi:hypothetical protein